ncbi:DUF3592 domain-containing protein [Oceanobacillus sp. FSL W7-1293]|uniref:DUF3592 domain-containing protein n=1 Tax=Oceanobacillus TaxID=182709 RepID=UPI0030CC6F39
MAFIGLLLCIVALFVIFLKLKSVLTGELVAGKIIGYNRGAKGRYSIVAYNYRVLLEYNDELYYVTSIDTFTATDGVIPRKYLGMYCWAYFNPKAPDKRVALKGFHRLEWMAFFLFLLGALIIIIDLARML